MPICQLKQWLDEEKIAGAPNPAQAVLATCTSTGIPHSRVIAIREILENCLIFFTQKGTRKTDELLSNPLVSLNFWFELTQRQIIIEGEAQALSEKENETYWHSYSRFAQIRFSAYAPTSSQVIESKKSLEDKRYLIEQKFKSQEVPVHPLYSGFRIIPNNFLFYVYRIDELSDVTRYSYKEGQWQQATISP